MVTAVYTHEIIIPPLWYHRGRGEPRVSRLHRRMYIVLDRYAPPGTLDPLTHEQRPRVSSSGTRRLNNSYTASSGCPANALISLAVSRTRLVAPETDALHCKTLYGNVLSYNIMPYGDAYTIYWYTNVCRSYGAAADEEPLKYSWAIHRQWRKQRGGRS